MSLGKLTGTGKSQLKPIYRVGNYAPALANTNTSSDTPSSSSPLTYARVKDVCTSPDHPLYKALGIKSLGAVVLQNISSNTISSEEEEIDYSNLGNLFIAYPLFPNIKNYPLKGEIVITLFAPDFTSQITTTNIDSYYICTPNIWNNSHHNVLPDSRPEESSKSLTSNSQYFNDIPSNSGVEDIAEAELGEYFTENEFLKNLLSYEGDIIYEGRFGNSIRFGSTNKDTFINNNWSDAGNNGDPLTIIRVKKFTIEDTSVGLEETPPTLEDINNDDSSIWITSTQKIPIDINFL